jgi:hypothetical protein
MARKGTKILERHKRKDSRILVAAKLSSGSNSIDSIRDGERGDYTPYTNGIGKSMSQLFLWRP